jgi:hypothetical protein
MRGLLIVLSCVLAGACAAHAAPPPRTSLDPAEQPQTVAPREPESAPKLIAPPPAYGNKIVMARAKTTTEGRF